MELPINKLLCGDCLEIMRTFPKESVDIILTDPPYFLPAKHYQTRKEFKRNFADLGIVEGFFKSIFSEFDRILKRSGLLYVFCDGQSYPLFYFYSYPITKSVRPLIWDKKVSFTGYYWRHQHELILFGVRPESKKIPTGYGDILRFNAVKVNDRNHPAQKPLDLIEYILEKTSKENDIVLDPFTGSGTVCVASKKLGRRWIGIELSREYIELAKNRLDNCFIINKHKSKEVVKSTKEEKKEDWKNMFEVDE